MTGWLDLAYLGLGFGGGVYAGFLLWRKTYVKLDR